MLGGDHRYDLSTTYDRYPDDYDYDNNTGSTPSAHDLIL
jgi:hypothetical protein